MLQYGADSCSRTGVDLEGKRSRSSVQDGKSRPLVTVVVPVYNVSGYIRQCLDSLINQTLTDIEIIVVDDGSTDDSGRICDEYAKKDPRIFVIHKNNEGLACARNDAIDMASAPYVMFVDSDDWAEPGFCEISYKAAVEHDADIVLFTYNSIWHSGKEERVDLPYRLGEMSEEDALDYNLHFVAAVWAGIYRKALFEKNKYPSGKLYEDEWITHKLIRMAKKIYLIDQALYNYREDRPGSITTSAQTREHPDRKEASVQKILDLNEWGYEENIRERAFNLLVRYGCKGQRRLVEIARKWNAPKNAGWGRRASLQVLKFSPVLFDGLLFWKRAK